MKYVNLGCGANRIEGWENYDTEIDITQPLPFESETVDFILIEHCLEHVTPGDALRFMIEARRVLRAGGVLRICVPVIDNLSIEHGREIIWGHGHQGAYSPDLVRHMLRLACFSRVVDSPRRECDGHFRVIGYDKDDLETYRVEARP